MIKETQVKSDTIKDNFNLWWFMIVAVITFPSKENQLNFIEKE